MDTLQPWLDVAAQLRSRVPFLSEALNLIPIVRSSQVTVAAVDAKSIMVNPEGFDAVRETILANNLGWYPTEQAAKAVVLMHECLHLVLKSNERERGREHETWNQACDFVINYFIVDLFRLAPFSYDATRLQQLELALASSGLYDRKYYGMDAESVYELLLQDKKKMEANSSAGSGGGSGGQEGEPPGGSGTPAPGQKVQVSLFGDDFGENVPKSDVPADVSTLLDARFADYLERNKGFMDTGSALSHEVDEAMKQPPILMSRVLCKIRDVVNTNVYSYKNPSRADAFGVFFGLEGRMPSFEPNPSDKVRELVVAVDASASMSLAEKQTALTLVRASFKYTKHKVRLLVFTTQVVQDEELTERSTITIHHTGGTRIASIIDYIEQQEIKPSAVVIITDGEDPLAPARFRVWRMLNRCRTIIVRNHKKEFPGIHFHCDVCQ